MKWQNDNDNEKWLNDESKICILKMKGKRILYEIYEMYYGNMILVIYSKKTINNIQCVMKMKPMKAVSF